MVASAMDFIFAADNALFLALPYPSDYWSVTWELGQRKTKEILYEHRFLAADEALALGFVNRVYPLADLEAETLAYAERVAQNDPLALRDVKQIVNQTMDGMGFTQSVQRRHSSPACAAPSPPAGTRTGNWGREGCSRPTRTRSPAWCAARCRPCAWSGANP